MTSTADTVQTRPSYRPYRAYVHAVRRLSPHFVRVTFRGEAFEHFGTAGCDQRIKLLLPLSDGTLSDVGVDDDTILAAGGWYALWRELPADRRSHMRTYTVRRIDTRAGEVTVDFVVHHDAGPAGAWADNAGVGDELIIVGPDERSPGRAEGIDWHPGTARRILLAGDETAVPAVSGILESLDPSYEVDAFLEVPSAEDFVEIAGPVSARVVWLARDDAPHGEVLHRAVRRWAETSGDVLSRAAAPRAQVLEEIDVDRELLWDSPGDGEGEFYAWIAGESAMVKTLRRLLVQGHGVDRKRVAFMGYWRLGQSERQE